MDNTMEFMSEAIGDVPIQWGSDFTLLPTGDHNVSMTVGDTNSNVSVNVERTLDVIKLTYEANNHIYVHNIHPDGRRYSHVSFLGDETSGPREWQERGMWRHY